MAAVSATAILLFH